MTKLTAAPGPVFASVSLLALLLSGCMVTPKPMTGKEVSDAAQASLQASFAEQEKVSRPIDLSEAMARAVRYNLDQRVEMLQAVVRSREINTASLASLPALAANAGYAGRNKYDAASSRSVITGLQSLQTSTSQDLDINTADLALSWNVLDFGLSYVRAQQAAERELIAQEERRKVIARIVEEVRAAYWRALAAEYLSAELKKLDQRIHGALSQSEALVAKRQTSPVAALTYQRDLYELKERIQQVEQEVVAARSQLASLMNLPPGTTFALVRPAGAATPLKLPANLQESIATALRARPEIREAMYGKTIEEKEATAIILQMLPGISLAAGSNYTSNSYTYAPEWLNWGARLSWNLISLAGYPIRHAEQQAREDVAEERVKATIASVALQVHVARLRYELARRRADTLGEYEGVQQRLLVQLKASAATDQSGDNELVREELNALLARARRDVAIADMQASYGAVLTSLGVDPYPDEETASLAELAAAFRAKAKAPIRLADAKP